MVLAYVRVTVFWFPLPLLPANYKLPVNLPDTDTVVTSSDGVDFYLHRQNLATYTGCLPIEHAITSNNMVKIQLPEPASVLEVIFEYEL